MSVEQVVKELDEAGVGPMVIKTDVYTSMGMQVLIEWEHGGYHCVVIGHTLDEALRKVSLMEEEFRGVLLLPPTD